MQSMTWIPRWLSLQTYYLCLCKHGLLVLDKPHVHDKKTETQNNKSKIKNIITNVNMSFLPYRVQEIDGAHRIWYTQECGHGWFQDFQESCCDWISVQIAVMSFPARDCTWQRQCNQTHHVLPANKPVTWSCSQSHPSTLSHVVHQIKWIYMNDISNIFLAIIDSTGNLSLDVVRNQGNCG